VGRSTEDTMPRGQGVSRVTRLSFRKYAVGNTPRR
jgi:hypothetical protein